MFKKILKSILNIKIVYALIPAIVATFAVTTCLYAVTVILVPQGGTGSGSFTQDQIIIGSGTGALTSTSTIQGNLEIKGNATTTKFAADEIGLNGVYRTTWPSGTSKWTDQGTWLHPAANEGIVINASSTITVLNADTITTTGDLSVGGNATTTKFAADEIGLNGVYRTTWPSGTSKWTDQGTWLHPTTNEGIVINASSTITVLNMDSATSTKFHADEIGLNGVYRTTWPSGTSKWTDQGTWLHPTTNEGIVINASSTITVLNADTITTTGDLSVGGNASSTKFAADEIGLNGVYRTTWPSGTSKWTDNGTWLNPTNDEGLVINASSTFTSNLKMGNATTSRLDVSNGTNGVRIIPGATTTFDAY